MCSAITMRAMALASETPATVLDWNNNYGDDENKVILFHCGPVPTSLMTDKGKMSVTSGFTKMNATGGGANSSVWMQMKADVLNIPITALKTVEAGTVGCAMLTGIAVGMFKDLRNAAELMIDETVTYEPRADMQEQYCEVFERYEQVYCAVRLKLDMTLSIFFDAGELDGS